MKLLPIHPIKHGRYAKLDDSDYEKASQWKWETLTSGLNTIGKPRKLYVVRRFYTTDGKRVAVLLHRWLTNADKGLEVDHINGDTFDNQQHNLRVVPKHLNLGNRHVLPDNPGGFIGVHLSKTSKSKRWSAHIGYNGRQIHIGQFDTAASAAFAYDQKAVALRGPITHLNFPMIQQGMKVIVIEIDAQGGVKLEGVGFVGKACDEKMKAFEDALGTVTDRKNSPEYSKTVTTTQKVGQ